MGKGNCYLIQDNIIKAIFKKIVFMAMENILQKMQFMMGNGNLEINLDQVNKFIMMALFIQADFLMVIKMELEYFNGKMGHFIKGCSNKIK